ncbi:MAG: NfeD family protein [Candidatus Mcinerneyibacterium aminivorans]|jgi:membrane protein implicated in regulation of membrane protease activity|uniref:NfeD family protein n=1 Tax=Candidatus Mcinerneyibacterium aminivorans TaxID=2703815 RepID=A0A5D0MGL1_9BACT|nr:MAG: NfeD family protein [Candidatus Mcinerneyibacterium aminivorans]
MIRMPFYYWLIFGVLLIVVEIFTPGFFAATLGVSAVITSVVSLIIPSYYTIQWLFFVVLNIVIFVFLRDIFLKYLYGREGNETNISGLVGKEGIVREKIDKETGYVQIYGDMWKAKSIDDHKIEIGEKIIVKQIEGNKVLVKKKDEN